MNAPMILPWLARKWGVSDERALLLWRTACACAEAEVGNSASPKYWATANDRLIDLLDNEVIAQYPVAETPWIMIHLNVLRLVAEVRFWIARNERRFAAVLSA